MPMKDTSRYPPQFVSQTWGEQQCTVNILTCYIWRLGHNLPELILQAKHRLAQPACSNSEQAHLRELHHEHGAAGLLGVPGRLRLRRRQPARHFDGASRLRRCSRRARFCSRPLHRGKWIVAVQTGIGIVLHLPPLLQLVLLLKSHKHDAQSSHVFWKSR